MDNEKNSLRPLLQLLKCDLKDPGIIISFQAIVPGSGGKKIEAKFQYLVVSLHIGLYYPEGIVAGRQVYYLIIQVNQAKAAARLLTLSFRYGNQIAVELDFGGNFSRAAVKARVDMHQPQSTCTVVLELDAIVLLCHNPIRLAAELELLTVIGRLEEHPGRRQLSI